MNSKLEIHWCSLCQGITIICPKCGNNTCNGAYGKAIPDNFPAGPNDEKCPICPNCYIILDKLRETGLTELIEEIIPDKPILTPNNIEGEL